jgi:DNA-binding transcriptional regulator YdaS (Cro superfamily)
MSHMDKKIAFEHFGGARAVAKALGISTSAVHQWSGVVPLKSAFLLERASAGALSVDMAAYKPSGRAKNKSRESV